MDTQIQMISLGNLIRRIFRLQIAKVRKAESDRPFFFLRAEIKPCFLVHLNSKKAIKTGPLNCEFGY